MNKATAFVVEEFGLPVAPAVSLWLLLAAPLAAATIHQIADGDVPGLITALEAADDGDTILLAQGGVYTVTAVDNHRNGPNGLPVIGREIVIEGRGATVQRAGGAPPFRLFYLSGVGSGMILSGVTIRNGRLDDEESGAGIYLEASSPQILDCTFDGNEAFDGSGGALFNVDSSPAISNTTFRNNQVEHSGGAIFNRRSDPVIQDSLFEGNYAFDSGGAISNTDSHPVIAGTIFRGNGAFDFGAAIDNRGSHPTVSDSRFEENGGDWGGGISNRSSSSPAITGSVFRDNVGTFYGGGIFNDENSSPTIEECVFEGNWALFGGGGVANLNNSNPVLTGSSFIGNEATDEGGAIHNEGSSPSLINCAVVDNRAHRGGGMANLDNSHPRVRESAFEGNAATAGGGIFSEAGSSAEIASTEFCGNDPDHLDGPWHDLGGNQFSDQCGTGSEPPPAPRLLADLIGSVEASSIQGGLRNSLQAPLASASASLERGNTAAASGALQAFVNGLSARGGRLIPAAEASDWAARAEEILAILANR